MSMHLFTSFTELHREFSLLEAPASLSAQTSLTYIASLEDGVSEMSDELEQTIRQQVRDGEWEIVIAYVDQKYIAWTRTFSTIH